MKIRSEQVYGLLEAVAESIVGESRCLCATKGIFETADLVAGVILVGASSVAVGIKHGEQVAIGVIRILGAHVRLFVWGDTGQKNCFVIVYRQRAAAIDHQIKQAIGTAQAKLSGLLDADRDARGPFLAPEGAKKGPWLILTVRYITFTNSFCVPVT